jgi:hypothetical protein
LTPVTCGAAIEVPQLSEAFDRGQVIECDIAAQYPAVGAVA